MIDDNAMISNQLITHFSIILSNISLLERFVHSLSLFFACKLEKVVLLVVHADSKTEL